MTLERMIAVAKGEEPADLVITGGTVVNVLSGELHEADVAIFDGRVVGFGAYEGRARIDASGLYVAPGFIDAHLHIESTMVSPREFARAVVPTGTTAVVADPHEIANVLGVQGIAYMLAASRDLPLTIFFMLPSCVPTTDMETAGARLDAGDLEPFLSQPRVLGLGEVMNCRGVLDREPGLLAKIRAARGRPVDGHAPGLGGNALNAYVAAGIRSDHECTTPDEAREKLRVGMYLLIREGSVAKNLEALLPLVTGSAVARCALVSDDRHPLDLVAEGHVNALVKRAVGLGLPPATAIQMVTINPATHFLLSDLGAVAPGYRADVVLLEDLKEFRAVAVLKDGRVVAKDGQLIDALPPSVGAPRATVNIAWDRMPGFGIRAEGRSAKVIGVIPDQLLTRALRLDVLVRDGQAVADPARDIVKLAVVERHRGTGNVGLGFVQGLGIRAGALASSVAHDSHNIVVAGTDDRDMAAAVRAVERMNGGLVAVKDEQVRAAVRLPIAGLMSDEPIGALVAELERALEAARALGSRLRNPFMTLSFLALPVVPSLKLTDRGLVDVDRSCLVSLFGQD